MILVTGASSPVGAALARLLARLGRPVRLLGRSAARIAAHGPGGEAFEADYGDPARLREALRGVSGALLVTNDPLRPDHDANLVEQARRAGVRRVVRLSALSAAEAGADDLISRWHREADQRVQDCGLEWTILRSRAFMSNALSWTAGIRAGVVRAAYGHARSPCIDPRDIAEVALSALTTSGHAGRIYALTGPEPLSAAQQTAVLAEVLGRPIRFEQLPVEHARANLMKRLPEPVADALIAGLLRRAAHGTQQVDPTVERLTGRPAGTFRRWAADHAELFG